MAKSDGYNWLALKAIFENLEDAVVTHDLEDNILDCNPTAEQLFAVKAAACRGKSIYTLIPAEFYKEHAETLEQLRSGSKVVHLRTFRLSATGHLIPVSMSVSPIKNDVGIIIGFLQMIREGNSDRDVEGTESILATIVEDSQDAIIGKTTDGYITSWNRGAEQIYGYTKEEVIGQHISMLIPPEKMSEENAILSDIRQGNKIAHLETVRKAKSGDNVMVSLTVSPIKTKTGKIIGISKIAQDITHKKIAEQRQAILAAIVENSDDAIISKTLDGFITSWNRGAERIFGYKEQEVIGKHITIIIPPDRMAEETEILQNIRAGITVDHFQTVRLRKGGMPLEISVTISPVKDSDGNIIGASKIARDITSEKESQAVIKELSQKKDEFIAMASHELKTPLTSMSGYLQLLEKMVPEDKRSFVEKIIRQQEKLNFLLNDLFDMSKIQSGKLKLFFKVFDMAKLITDIVDPFREANPDFSFDLELQENLFIEADQMRLEQVIINLLTNAVKYSPERGNIVIHAAVHESEFYFSIKDHGLGIEPENLRVIFSQFFRAERTERKITGLGLGLYITKEILERHGGKIWARSDVGQGAEFSFVLPVAQHN